MRRCVVLRYKSVVAGGYKPSPGEVRFWGVVGANYASQLTSYNTGANFEDAPQVESGLAACSIDDKGIVFAVEKGSNQEQNLRTGGMCSLMWGSTNPQIHHFFKQLGVKCWTALITGTGNEIREWGEMETLWSMHFMKNPYLINKLILVNRAKVQNANFRLSNVPDEEEEEEEVSVTKLDDFSLWRLNRQNGFLGRPPGGLDKVSVITIPQLDPLREHVHKWIPRMNSRRDILIEGVRSAYSIPLTNAFAFHLDTSGIYIMGCTQEDPTWQEYFLEWGPSMRFDSPHQVKSWWVEFVKQANVSYDDVYVDKPDSLSK